MLDRTITTKKRSINARSMPKLPNLSGGISFRIARNGGSVTVKTASAITKTIPLGFQPRTKNRTHSSTMRPIKANMNSQSRKPTVAQRSCTTQIYWQLRPCEPERLNSGCRTGHQWPLAPHQPLRPLRPRQSPQRVPGITRTPGQLPAQCHRSDRKSAQTRNPLVA